MPGAEGRKPQGGKGYKGSGPRARPPPQTMALLLLTLGLSLVSAQELNPRAVVQKNYDMAKVGLRPRAGHPPGAGLQGGCPPFIQGL